MRKRSVAAVFVLVACTSGPQLPKAPSGASVLEVRGAVKGGPFSLGLADLDKLPHRTIRGLDPRTGAEGEWSGASVASIVSERVKLARGADTVIVRTVDGAAIPIPLTLIRQFQPVLVERPGGARGPGLAWPTLEQRGLETDPRAPGWWARDVVAFEVVEWQRALAPALALPDGASDEARRGAASFGDRCISCHTLRGAGGRKGPDLTTAAARVRRGPFAALLERHPGAPPPGGERDAAQDAAEVWSFLRAVAATPGTRADALTADRGVPQADHP